jgi:MraZ protein
MEEEAQSAKIEPPLGMYPTRLDDRGRLKMPAIFLQYFSALPQKRLFVTSLDRTIARIYTAEAWRESLKFLEASPLPMAEEAAFNAADLGAETEMDNQGRITLPVELRQELGLENQTLRLQGNRQHIDVLSERIYEELKRGGRAVTPTHIKQLQVEGLK